MTPNLSAPTVDVAAPNRVILWCRHGCGTGTSWVAPGTPAPAGIEPSGAVMPDGQYDCLACVDGEEVPFRREYIASLRARVAALEAEREGLRLAAKNVVLAFHDWPEYTSGSADDERLGAIASLADALTSEAAHA